MKLKIEWIYLAFIAIVVILSITWVTPRSDNYFMYYASREFLRNPDFLWKNLDEVRSPTLGTGVEYNGVFNYPPLTMFLYSLLILFNLPPILLITISFIIIVFFTYKLNNKAVPLLFISFLFLRTVIQGESDVFVVALALVSVYFFDKKPLISGIFAALAFLSKQTGVMVVGWFILSILIFKRKELRLSIKNVYILSIIFVILLVSIWYARNYVLNEGDIVGMITGNKLSLFKEAEQFLRGGIQASGPEMFFIDTSGYYPNPIDLLLVLGTIALIYNVFKTKKINHLSFLLILSLATYSIVQFAQIRSIMPIRYYLLMFPLFTIIIANNLKEKYFKYLLIISIVIFIFYISSLQKYAYNQLKDQIDQACPQIKEAVDMKPVYVDFFHHIFLAYECDLNLTSLNHSMLIVNLTSGSIYPTNRSA